jgi:hypothetical protein
MEWGKLYSNELDNIQQNLIFTFPECTLSCNLHNSSLSPVNFPLVSVVLVLAKYMSSYLDFWGFVLVSVCM